MTTKRIHNISGLKAEIKTIAATIREDRDEARKLSGLERHEALVYANDPDARYMLLAYGYLRGKTIAQMESEHTRPENLPDADDILAFARQFYMKGPDAPEWQDTTQQEIPVPDDRNFLGKLRGRKAPEPKVVTKYPLPPGWDEFSAMVKADIKAWKTKVIAAHAFRQAQKQAKKAKKVTPMTTHYRLKGEMVVGDDSYAGYHCESCGGEGTLDEMLDLAHWLAERNGRDKAEWDNTDPKWRGTFRPTYRKLRLFRVESQEQELDLQQHELKGYNTKLAEIEKQRADWRAEKEAQDRAEYERLRTKYEQAS